MHRNQFGSPNGESPSDSTRSALLERAIANLSDAAIESMADDELLFVIRNGNLSYLVDRNWRRLEFADRQTLLRMAHLARRACRQVAAGEAGGNGQAAAAFHGPR